MSFPDVEMDMSLETELSHQMLSKYGSFLLCPQILWYCLYQEVESNLPIPSDVWLAWEIVSNK